MGSEKQEAKSLLLAALQTSFFKKRKYMGLKTELISLKY